MIASPGDFKGQLKSFVLLVRERQKDVFHDACAMAGESIQNGSPITGAPGQPVQTSELLNSWQIAIESDTQARIWTNSIYATAIEDGMSKWLTRKNVPLTLRSSRGGWHSVKLTVSGWPRILAAANAKRQGGGAA